MKKGVVINLKEGTATWEKWSLNRLLFLYLFVLVDFSPFSLKSSLGLEKYEMLSVEGKLGHVISKEGAGMFLSFFGFPLFFFSLKIYF